VLSSTLTLIRLLYRDIKRKLTIGFGSLYSGAAKVKLSDRLVDSHPIKRQAPSEGIVDSE